MPQSTTPNKSGKDDASYKRLALLACALPSVSPVHPGAAARHQLTHPPTAQMYMSVVLLLFEVDCRQTTASLSGCKVAFMFALPEHDM